MKETLHIDENDQERLPLHLHPRHDSSARYKPSTTRSGATMRCCYLRLWYPRSLKQPLPSEQRGHRDDLPNAVRAELVPANGDRIVHACRTGRQVRLRVRLYESTTRIVSADGVFPKEASVNTPALQFHRNRAPQQTRILDPSLDPFAKKLPCLRILRP